MGVGVYTLATWRLYAASIGVALRLCAFGRPGGGICGAPLGVMAVLLGAEDAGEQRFHAGLSNLDMR